MHNNDVITNFLNTLKEELINYGIDFKENDRELILLCPFCLSENKYKIKLYVNKENLLYHCFRCEKSGNVYTIGKILKGYNNHGINLEKTLNYYVNFILDDDTINNILRNSNTKTKYIKFVDFFTKDDDLEDFYTSQFFVSKEFNKIKKSISKNDIFENNLKYLSKRLSIDKNFIKHYFLKMDDIKNFILLNIKENEIHNFTFFKFYGEKRNIGKNSRYYKYKLTDLIEDNEKHFIITFPDFSLIRFSNKEFNNKKSLVVVEGIFDLLSIYFYGFQEVFYYYIKNFDKEIFNIYIKRLEDIFNSNIFLSHLSGYKNYERLFYFLKILYFTNNTTFDNIIFLLDRDISLQSLHKINNIVKSIYIPHLESLFNKKINFDIYRINSILGKDLNEFIAQF